MTNPERIPNGDDNGQNPPTSRIALGKRPFSKIDLDGHDLPPSPAPSSPRNGNRYALATELVYTEGTDQYGASSTPIYQVRDHGWPQVLTSDCPWRWLPVVSLLRIRWLTRS